MTISINSDAIIDAIVTAPRINSPLARDAGASLVDAWMRKHFVADASLKIETVEAGFVTWVDEHTALIGVQDLIASDADGILGGEWKSAKEPKRNKDGADSAWWNEEVWLREISSGPQLAIYALALNRGTYYEAGKAPRQFNVAAPRILVRAAVKSNPPKFWPTETSGIFQFSAVSLESTVNAVRSKAAQIRAARKLKVLPWQLTGKQCMQYNRECAYFDVCRSHVHPDLLELTAFDKEDPAAQLALPHIAQERLIDPELVVLSASSYDLASTCMEKYRLIAGSIGEKESSLALDTGSAMHAGLAAYYRQLRDGATL